MAKKKSKPKDDEDDSQKKKKKKKAAPREEEEEDTLEEASEDDEPKRKGKGRDDDDEDEEDDLPIRPKTSGNDAYTGMLAITLIAFIAACVLFYLDSSSLTAQPVQPPSINVPGLGETPKTTTTRS